MKRFIIIAIAVFINGAFAFAQKKADTLFTLQQCLDIAIKNNLQIKQSSVQMEINKIYWQQARENMLPTLNGNINHSVSDGRSLNPFTNGYLNQQITSANYGLSSSLVLSNGLVLQNSIRQTALAYQAGQMDFQQAKDNLTLNIITAYLQVLSNEDQLTQAVTQASVTQGQVGRFDVLNKEGAVQPANLYDLKGSLANSQLALISAKNDLANAKLTLLQLMNLPYTGTFEVQRTLADQLPTPYTETFEQIYGKALNDMAYVKAATLRRESAEKGVKAARGALLPSLSLSGGLGTNYSSAAQRSVFLDSVTVPTREFVNTAGGGKQTVFTTQQNYINQNISYKDQFSNNYGTSVSLGLSVPILNYFQNKNRVTIAKLNLQNAQYVEQSTQIQLRQNIEQAYLNMTSAYERYKLLVEQVSAYAESYRISEIRFNSGVITSVDFLITKGNLDNAKNNLINARYDYLIRTKILDYYQGRLSL